ncbi:MAG: beta strand repeat-containing protein, partial [Gammaproteobacteria bacterium]
ETGIFSRTNNGAVGNAGSISLTGAMLSIVNGGGVSSTSVAGSGDAGNVVIEADDILIDRKGAANVTGIFSRANSVSEGNAGKITVNGRGTLSILNGGNISSSTFGPGSAGGATVAAREIIIDGGDTGKDTGIFSNANSGSGGNAGSVEVSVEEMLSILNGGSISTDTYATGSAGSVSVDAGEILIDRRGTAMATGIFSRALNQATGNAGSVGVISRNKLSILNGGTVNSSTFADGNAGDVSVHAGELSIDRNHSEYATGNFSNAAGTPESKVVAGSIEVIIDGPVSLMNGGAISTDTSTFGDAGNILIRASDILIDGLDEGIESAISSNANQDSHGRAGSVKVSIGDLLTIRKDGNIGTNTYGTGNAGEIVVEAGRIVIDREGSTHDNTGILSRTYKSQGDAGTIKVDSRGTLALLNGGNISSSTFAEGKAGEVLVWAKELLIDGGLLGDDTGIFSNANTGAGEKAAGFVKVYVDGLLTIRNGGTISTDTFAEGDAGNIDVDAGNIVIARGTTETVTGIISRAKEGSSGNTGSVTVTSRGSLIISDGGSLSITSDAVTDPNRKGDKLNTLSVNAQNIVLDGGSQISAAATGSFDASNISVNSERLTVRGESKINTSAQVSNGGAININAERYVLLQDGQVTTSVEGEEGNGGNIVIDTPVLIMDTGFIQGNTAAPEAAGGDIALRVEELLPNGNVLLSGGEEPLAFLPGSGQNVVQAAAPDGVSGNITITAPQLNITGLLSGIETPGPDPENVGQDPCSPEIRQNTLKRMGRGAVTYFKMGHQLQTLERLLETPDASPKTPTGPTSRTVSPERSRSKDDASLSIRDECPEKGRSRSLIPNRKPDA